jgi:hypothetical protein
VDDYMSETISKLVFGEHSVCQDIENSEVYKASFAKCLANLHREMLDHPTSRATRAIRTLRASKVRFDSVTKPMGRFVLYLSAVMSVLVKAAAMRRGLEEGRRAAEHLQFIDNERILTLAMLADAGDESLRLARYYDTGSHDPATASAVHTEYCNRIDFLFVKGRCFTSGFTGYALQLLESQTYNINLREGSKAIGGGVSAAVRRRCMRRMQCWVYLAVDTVQAEFPKWGAVQSLEILNLACSSDPTAESGPVYGASVRRMAQMLGISDIELSAELDEVFPLAHHIKSASKGISNIDAWREAFSKLTARRHNCGRLHALRSVLVRACAWQGSTTSKVEQTFSRMERWANS